MSRAFTKEADNETIPGLPDRSVAAGPNPVTPRGAQRIQEILRDLSERYRTDKSESLARDLRYWEARRATMEVVPLQPNQGQVGFGARVAIERRGVRQEVQIVGSDEADPKAGLLSWTSPLARAMEGAAVGETVFLDVRGAEEPISIVAIRADDERMD